MSEITPEVEAKVQVMFQRAANEHTRAERCRWCGEVIEAGEPTRPRSSTLFQRDPHPLHPECAEEFDQA